MEDSGLEQLWNTVYALKSINKMMEGKSYSKALRACLLTDAALHVLMLECSKLQQPDTGTAETLVLDIEFEDHSVDDLTADIDVEEDAANAEEEMYV